ncbi:MAG: nucleotidyltransferase domain-containing protein [Clostridium sp.]|nr:nucleotidyltransferase domain-containing protein [Clostridium sp.]
MRDIAREINEKLTEIEKKENVKVLYAVESGSRAWGVESPDSDYDVRFVYVREKKDYLRLCEKRDVIEWQLDEVLDINGWDLKKTLVQFHKGNATLFEWANSPIVYKTTDAWKKIYQCGKGYFSEKSALYHYYGTANSTYKQYLQEDYVKYKKYIYALRPILACKYIEENHSVPPVRFEELLKQKLRFELSDAIKEMLKIKAQSDEKALNPKIPIIHNYIEDEITRYGTLSKSMRDDRTPEWDMLDEVFCEILDGSCYEDTLEE